MNITSLIVNVIGLAFYSWLVWNFYQMYLASWNRENAKENWVLAFNSPLALAMQPIFKWLILVLFTAGSLSLILLFINFLMQITLAVMGANHAT